MELSGQLHAPNEMKTARGAPKRSPIQVLTMPNEKCLGLKIKG